MTNTQERTEVTSNFLSYTRCSRKSCSATGNLWRYSTIKSGFIFSSLKVSCDLLVKIWNQMKKKYAFCKFLYRRWWYLTSSIGNPFSLPVGTWLINKCYDSWFCRRNYFCLRRHEDEANASIQQKMTHQPLYGSKPQTLITAIKWRRKRSLWWR